MLDAERGAGPASMRRLFQEIEMRHAALVIALAAAGLVWTGVRAQQEVRSTPGLGSGTMTVRGTVDVGNMPDVSVAQRGAWRVGVTDLPPVSLSGPSFVRKGGRYRIAWTGAEAETVTVLDPGQAGWVRVETSGARPRWINLSAAREIQETP
jgi:hypothetical protein